MVSRAALRVGFGATFLSSSYEKGIFFSPDFPTVCVAILNLCKVYIMELLVCLFSQRKTKNVGMIIMLMCKQNQWSIFTGHWNKSLFQGRRAYTHINVLTPAAITVVFIVSLTLITINNKMDRHRNLKTLNHPSTHQEM